MRISTVLYSIKAGLKNIYKNKMFSLASIATMAACIFLFGMFYSIVVNFQHVIKAAESGVSITVFFDEGITDDQVKKIGEEIANRSEVSKYNYISAEQAWDNFKKEYFGESSDLAEGFAQDNPLANSDSYEIYLNDVSMQKSLVTYLESLDGVREVKRSEVAANTLSDFNVLAGYISLTIIVILLAVSIFLISNTVTVGIAVRREEIRIMKLIGATDFFVKAPFLIEGVLIGLIGSVLPLIALYFMYNNVITYVSKRFHVLEDVLQFLPLRDVFSLLIPISLGIGVGIGFIGSMITIRKHLKV